MRSSNLLIEGTAHLKLLGMARVGLQRLFFHAIQGLEQAQIAQPQQLISLAEFSVHGGVARSCVARDAWQSQATIQSSRLVATRSDRGSSAIHAICSRAAPAAHAPQQFARFASACGVRHAVAASSAGKMTATNHTAARGFAARAIPRRQAGGGSGGWRSNPTHQALYLVSTALLALYAAAFMFRTHLSSSQGSAASIMAQSRQICMHFRVSLESNQCLDAQIAFTVGMVGVTYAAVPLYRMFCQVRLLSAATLLLLHGASVSNEQSVCRPCLLIQLAIVCRRQAMVALLQRAR